MVVFGKNHSLPVELSSFTASTKSNNDVLARMDNSFENNVNRFEIEVAKGNAAYQQNQFVKIGEVNSEGNSVQQQQYSFTDLESNKSGIRYYRLKIIDPIRSFSYLSVF